MVISWILPIGLVGDLHSTASECLLAKVIGRMFIVTGIPTSEKLKCEKMCTSELIEEHSVFFNMVLKLVLYDV